MPSRDVGGGERVGFLGEHRVEHDLEQQVAELVGERGPRRGVDVVAARRRVEREDLDGVDDLVGLFEQVTGERVVSLLGVPRAATRPAQAAPEGEQRAERVGAAGRQVCEQRGEVIGCEHAVGLGERDAHDLLVGATEVMEEHDLVVGADAIEQRELQIRQHERGVELGEEHRTPGFERGRGEGATVEHARAVERVDAEPRPREVGERQAGDHLELDLARPFPLGEEHHGALRDHRAPGTAYDDRAALACRGHERVDDLAVHGFEIGCALVHARRTQ